MLFLRLMIVFILMGITTGCVPDRLYVQNRYLDYEDLASYHVHTRDPRKKNPDTGQRLIIHWSLSEEEMNCEELHLALIIRYRNREEEEICHPITKKRGHFSYNVLNDDYFSKHGILTYKAMIIGDDELLAEWRHQIWADILTLDQ